MSYLKLDRIIPLAAVLTVTFIIIYTYEGARNRVLNQPYSVDQCGGQNIVPMSYPGLQYLMHLTPPTFLPSYKNPCWRERMDPDTDPYAGNLFLFSNSKPIHQVGDYNRIRGLQASWQKQYKQGARQTERLRCLPYFYIIGAHLCGTTFLFNQLRKHPCIANELVKETHWWGKFSLGLAVEWPIPLHDYIDLFDAAAKTIDETVEKSTNFHPVIAGDGTPETARYHMLWPPVLQQTNLTVAHLIRHFTPDALFILSLRDPAKRAYSMYAKAREMLKKEVSPEDFHDVARKAVNLFTSCFKKRSVRACVYDNKIQQETRWFWDNIYYVYVQDWLEAVPRHQLLVSRLEDRSADPQQAYDSIFTFLGLEPIPNFEIIQKEKEEYRKEKWKHRGGDMLEATYKMLADFYRPFNHKLAALLEDDRFTWSGSM